MGVVRLFLGFLPNAARFRLTNPQVLNLRYLALQCLYPNLLMYFDLDNNYGPDLSFFLRYLGAVLCFYLCLYYHFDPYLSFFLYL